MHVCRTLQSSNVICCMTPSRLELKKTCVAVMCSRIFGWLPRCIDRRLQGRQGAHMILPARHFIQLPEQLARPRTVADQHHARIHICACAPDGSALYAELYHLRVVCIRRAKAAHCCLHMCRGGMPLTSVHHSAIPPKVVSPCDAHVISLTIRLTCAHQKQPGNSD